MFRTATHIVIMIHVQLFYNVTGTIIAAIEYIIYLQNQQTKQQEQLESLQREVKALQIMKE